MKHNLGWQFWTGIALIILSAVVYTIHYLIFHDVHHIFIYLLGDVAFVFIEVLLVTMVIHQLLMYREKRTMLKKLNMVIGVFFNEVGRDLLKIFAGFDKTSQQLGRTLVFKSEWTNKEVQDLQKQFKDYGAELDSRKGDLGALKKFLTGKRAFLLNLLENPNLLEHETFSDLLWAVFHLTDELLHRQDVNDLIPTDRAHLEGDMKRAYGLLISEWLAYMNHLKNDYPYLFSLAVRTNPFDPAASIEIKAS